jgi:NAD-dependent deacetylase
MKKNLVVLTGAGISADSGIQTFRDAGGLWEGHDIYEVASPQGWQRNPETVLDFYNQRRKKLLTCVPNAAHHGLVTLEEKYEVSIITQNVDDLHERAGSKHILHLHGELLKSRSCNNPNLIYNCTNDIHIGDLAEDGAQLRPHIVWFGENVTEIGNAIAISKKADIFVVIGTSLQVNPAASLIQYTDYSIPKYIIDPQHLDFSYPSHVIFIQKSATEGINELLTLL